MSDPIETIVRDVARSVLADCAFLLTEPAELPQAWSSAIIHAQIPFAGRFRGSVCITAEQALAETLATDMLGLEPGDPEALVSASAAVSELVNILAGALVARLFSTAVTCTLGLPRVGAGLPAVEPGPAPVSVPLSDLEGRLIHIELYRTDEMPS